MGLRTFHLFFIAVSVVLAAFSVAWAASEYQAAHQMTYVLFGVAGAVMAVGLIAYGAAFQKKTRQL
jgi:heme A synthase